MTAEMLRPSTVLPANAPSPAAAPAATPAEEDARSFAALGVHPRMVAALASMGIEAPTPIQARTIPPLLAGRDVVGQSRTGSGKTIAYGLPLLERIDPRMRRPQALVLVPTRELAGQVADVLIRLGAGRGLRVAQLIGGRSYTPQREALRQGAQVVVGAPGRVLDHIRQGALDLSALVIAVLDEADQMLDAGFAQDVERILAETPAERQLALFTATLPEMTRQVSKRHLREPIHVGVGSPEGIPAPTITQTIYTTPREHRLAALMALLDRQRENRGTTLVFGRTKHGVQKLARQLIARGYQVAPLHGNMSQNARDRALAEFRSGNTPVLLATNVAARGLDVLSIELVINYELPESAELFTHRVGRTGRMDNTGEAITLLTPDDMTPWRRMQRDLNLNVKPQPWPFGPLADASATAPVAASEVQEAPAVAAPLRAPEGRPARMGHREHRDHRGAARHGAAPANPRGWSERGERRERGFTSARPQSGDERQPARPATRRPGAPGMSESRPAPREQMRRDAWRDATPPARHGTRERMGRRGGGRA